MEAFCDVEKERDSAKHELEKLNQIQSQHNLTQKLHDKEMVEKAGQLREQKIAIAELEKMLQMKTNDIGDSLTTLDSKQTELAHAINQMEMLKQENVQYKAHNEELTRMLNENSSHAQLLEQMKQNERLMWENEQVKQEANTAVEQIGILSMENKNIQTKSEHDQRKLQELEETLNITKCGEQKSAQRIESLKEEYETMEKGYNESKQALSLLEHSHSNETMGLEMKIEADKKQINLLECEKQSLMLNKDDIKQKYQEQSRRLDEMKEKFDAFESENVKLVKNLENVHLQLNSAEQNVKELMAETSTAQTVIENLKVNTDNLQQENETLQNNLDAKTAESEEKSKSVELLEEKNCKLECKLVEIKSEMKKQHESIMRQEAKEDSPPPTDDAGKESFNNYVTHATQWLSCGKTRHNTLAAVPACFDHCAICIT